MKKKSIRVLHTIEVFVVLAAVTIFLLANPTTLKYFANTLTSTYNLKYKDISGNLLTNIHIKDITYKGKILSKEASIDFNLLKLLIMQIDVKSLKISKVDMNNLKYFINDISNNTSKSVKNKKNVKTENISLPLTVKVHNISLDINPYDKDKLKIDKLKIFIKNFIFTGKFKVDDLKVELKSNYFDLDYQGSYEKDHLYIDVMNISKLDIEKILLLKKILNNDSNSSESIIKQVDVKEAKLSIKPLKKGHYKIKSLDLSINSLSTDLKKFQIKDIKLKADTNIWKINSTGYVKENTFYSDVKVDIDNKYMKKFTPFINFNSLNPVKVILKIDKNRLVGDINTTSKKPLTKKYDDLKVVLKSLTTHAVFDFKGLNLHFVTNAKLSSKYSKDFKLKGDFYYNPKENIRYDGKVVFNDFQNIDFRLKKLLKDTKVDFQGDKKGITATAKSNLLNAEYDSKNSYLYPEVKLDSDEFYIKDLDENLSKDIKNAKMKFHIDTKLNYKKIQDTILKYKIVSNIVDIDGQYSVSKKLFSLLTTLPKDSLMSEKNTNLKELFPINSTIFYDKKYIKVDTKNSNLNLNAKYELSSKDYNLSVKGYQTELNLFQKRDKIFYTLHTDSVKELEKLIDTLYPAVSLKSDGDLTVKGIFEDKTAEFTVNSKWFLTEYSKYKYFFTENSEAVCSYHKNTLTIKQFNTSAYLLDRYRKLFSTKNSYISFNDNTIKLNLYLNDKINIKGDISDKSDIKISTYNYHLNQPEADLYLNANIRYTAVKNHSSLKGKVELLGGEIRYKPKKSYEINDKDIIFIGKKKKKQDSKNLNISINIVTKKQIKYKQNRDKIFFKSDITVFKKSTNQLKFFGTLDVISGSYFSDDKMFEIGSGKLLFGGDLLNPYLNLKAYYNKDPYNITIMIGGSLQAPVLNFTSTPYLSQNDILSILLFNTKASSLTNSDSNSNPALSLFGSSFAKGIMNTLGIKLDRVSLSTTKEGTIGVELEKRVGDKTTIIYQNDLVQTIKIRYQNTRHIETDMTFSPDSSSLDIIFKNEK